MREKPVALIFGTMIAVCSAVITSAGEIDFNRDVRPILSDKCFQCHGPDESTREAELRLDDENGIKADRHGLVVVKPNDPAGSELMRRITSHDESEVMPPAGINKPLTTGEIAILRQWIAEGASWSQHWAYVSPVRHEPPTVLQTGWPGNWIDIFLLAGLERRGICPSPDADPVTLLRRVSFDLTGLPPSHELAEEFLADPSGDQYEILVDQLLASPHYGERMAVYWMDLVRYADTVGYHGDQTQNISPYRDWVINAFNNNIPFDQFTRSQLAGDLLPSPNQEQRIATGYNRLLQTTHEGGLQPKEYRAIYAADRVRNVSAVWMGATVGCAQCHDHKFDPYTAKDFHALEAFFADVDDEAHFTLGSNENPTARPPELELPTSQEQEKLDQLTSRIEVAKRELETPELTEDVRTAVRNRLSQTEAELKRFRAGIRRTMITVALAQPRTVRLLPRGNWLDETGPIIEPAIPEFLGTLPSRSGRLNRLDLANWLVDPQNGVGLQTARVMVNRLWFLCFGSGLAGRLDDFGGQGEPPVHPELLDRLAHALVENGWDIRETMKLIVTSRAYRQSSKIRPELRDADPSNRLYARQSSFRLPAEMIRDNALIVSGLLVRDIGGPSVNPYQPEGYYRHLNFPERTYVEDVDQRQWRRGLYVHWQRQFLHPMLKAFDAPSREECTAQRPRSNTPLAALTLLNDPTFVEAARALAVRSLDADVSNDSERIAWQFHQAVTRQPTNAEVSILQRLLEENRTSFRARTDEAAAFLNVGLTEPPGNRDAMELAAWTSVSRAVLNLSEANTRN